MAIYNVMIFILQFIFSSPEIQFQKEHGSKSEFDIRRLFNFNRLIVLIMFWCLYYTNGSDGINNNFSFFARQR